MRRIANFIGLADLKVRSAAQLVATQRRHTHFTIDQLIDARVSGKVIELYRALIAEISAGTRKSERRASQDEKQQETDLLPGAVSRLNPFVPDRFVQIEHLYGELLAQAEARHKSEIEDLNTHLAQTEARHKAEIEKLSARHKSQVEELQDRLIQTNQILQSRSVALLEHEYRLGELAKQLRKQLWAIRRLSRLLDEAENAAVRLRSSRRWKLANLAALIKSSLSHGRKTIGYGHLEKVVAGYLEWRASHPEILNIEEEIRSLAAPGVPIPQARPKDSTPNEPPVPAMPIHSIHFQCHDDVDVSIIIPVFNQFRYTHACLASLQGIQKEARFEVILVDDGSTDETATLVPQVENLVYLRNETNSGFIASCNRGAAEARGKYLVFLNNDTTVKTGWLRALLETFADKPRAGIVGPNWSIRTGVFKKLEVSHGVMARVGTTASSTIRKSQNTTTCVTSITARQPR